MVSKVPVTFDIGRKKTKTILYPFEGGLEKHLGLDRTALTVKWLPEIRVPLDTENMPPLGAQIMGPIKEEADGMFTCTYKRSGTDPVYFHEHENTPNGQVDRVDAVHMYNYIRRNTDMFPWLRAQLRSAPRSITLVDTRSGQGEREAEAYNRASSRGRFAPYPRAGLRNKLNYGCGLIHANVLRPHCGDHNLHIFMHRYLNENCRVTVTRFKGAMVDGCWLHGLELYRNYKIKSHGYFPRSTVPRGWKLTMIGEVDIGRYQDIAPAWRREVTDRLVKIRNRGVDW